MRKTILLFFCLFAGILSAQNENNKWTFGGSAGIMGGFGDQSNFGVSLTPRAGYKASEQLELGMTAGYNLQNSRFFSSTIFGIGPFANYYFGRNFFLGAQFQGYIITQKIKAENRRIGTHEPALFIGGGYMQQVGNRTFMQFGAQYNVLWRENSSVFSTGFAPQIGVVYGL